MNSRQLHYAIELSEVLNFSQVAEKLNITQPTLSKQILTLESELGVKLFDRTTTPLSVTPAGRHFLQEAKELLYKEDQLLRSMEDYRSGQAGRLTIGISPFRSLYLIPNIVKQIHNQFPKVQVCLHEVSSDRLRQDASEGKFDFAIVNLPVDVELMEVIPLETDMLVLAVPEAMVAALPDRDSLTLNECGDLPFIVVGQQQEMRQLFEKLCTAADYHPNIAAETVGLASAWALVSAGVGISLLPKQFVTSNSFCAGLRLYGLQNVSSIRQPAIAYRKGQYLSEYAQYAISLLQK